MTARDASIKGLMCEAHAKRILESLVASKRAHLPYWVYRQPSCGSAVAAFAGGPGVNATAPSDTAGRIKLMLDDGHAVSPARAAALGLMSHATASRLLAALRDGGYCHVVDWVHEKAPTGAPAPVYVKGRGVDAPRPPAMSGREKTRRYRERLGPGSTDVGCAGGTSSISRDADGRAVDRWASAQATVRLVRHCADDEPLRPRSRTSKERQGAWNHATLMSALYVGQPAIAL